MIQRDAFFAERGNRQVLMKNGFGLFLCQYMEKLLLFHQYT